MSKIIYIVLIFLISLKMGKHCDRVICGNIAIAQLCFLLLYGFVFLERYLF